MRKTTVILLLSVLLWSCHKEKPVESGYGWLCIESVAMNGVDVMVNATRGSMDPDFGLNILTPEGQVVPGCSFDAGSVPGKIQLPAGDYRLEAFSSNIDNWRTSNSGKGSAAYRAEGAFSIEADMYQYVMIQAPLVNFGVCFDVEDELYKWFKSFSIIVTEAPSRKVTLNENENGWFDAATVSVVLTATNTDNDTYSSRIYTLHAETGHLYTLKYSLSPAQDGSFAISITIDDSFGDAGEELVILN